jgi:hypothetical protein
LFGYNHTGNALKYLDPLKEVTVTYNSTEAYWQPEFVDVYIQGSYASGYVLPEILIARNNYGPTETILQFNATVGVVPFKNPD